MKKNVKISFKKELQSLLAIFVPTVIWVTQVCMGSVSGCDFSIISLSSFLYIPLVFTSLFIIYTPDKCNYGNLDYDPKALIGSRFDYENRQYIIKKYIVYADGCIISKFECYCVINGLISYWDENELYQAVALDEIEFQERDIENA